jgi:hypothetical protein
MLPSEIKDPHTFENNTTGSKPIAFERTKLVMSVGKSDVDGSRESLFSTAYCSSFNQFALETVSRTGEKEKVDERSMKLQKQTVHRNEYINLPAHRPAFCLFKWGPNRMELTFQAGKMTLLILWS